MIGCYEFQHGAQKQGVRERGGGGTSNYICASNSDTCRHPYHRNLEICHRILMLTNTPVIHILKTTVVTLMPTSTTIIRIKKIMDVKRN